MASGPTAVRKEPSKKERLDDIARCAEDRTSDDQVMSGGTEKYGAKVHGAMKGGVRKGSTPLKGEKVSNQRCVPIWTCRALERHSLGTHHRVFQQNKSGGAMQQRGENLGAKDRAVSERAFPRAFVTKWRRI